MTQGCTCGRCSGCRAAWEAGEVYADDTDTEDQDEREAAQEEADDARREFAHYNGEPK